MTACTPIYVLSAECDHFSCWLRDERDLGVAHELAAEISRRVRDDIVVTIRDGTPIGRHCCTFRAGAQISCGCGFRWADPGARQCQPP